MARRTLFSASKTSFAADLPPELPKSLFGSTPYSSLHTYWPSIQPTSLSQTEHRQRHIAATPLAFVGAAQRQHGEPVDQATHDGGPPLLRQHPRMLRYQ